jgi:hypothetical protein
VFSEAQPAGGYSITSQLTDATVEFYAIAEDGTLAGYTNTKSLAASKDFSKMVVYGATNNDLITFEFKPTTLPTANGDQDSGAAPFIASVSDADLASIDDTTIITGGNFATNVAVTFTGTDNVVRSPKSIVRTDSTQLIVTRPDDFLEDNSPYTIEVSNPGIPQSAYKTSTSSVTAGGDPVWVTTAGALTGGQAATAYSFTLQATDPDGNNISYSLVSGSLPPGLSLNSSTGEISGTPTTLAAGPFTIAATDASGNSTNRSFSIEVSVASGGTTTAIDGYVVHTFTASGTFDLYADVNLEYLVVAGGGGGGGNQYHSGGGGAGGLLQGQIFKTAGSYSIEVGAGGSPGANSQQGNNGINSSALGLTSFGGGGAGSYQVAGGNGRSGGSGGGAAGEMNATSFGGSGTPGQGNDGGRNDQNVPGGGGGAGGVGGNANHGSPNNIAGNGGIGLESSISGTPTYYAGGGGASVRAGEVGGQGGLGGGGNGNASTGNPGQPNTGGGAGGPERDTSTNNATGGSGIVIIRYAI